MNPCRSCALLLCLLATAACYEREGPTTYDTDDAARAASDDDETDDMRDAESIARHVLTALRDDKFDQLEPLLPAEADLRALHEQKLDWLSKGNHLARATELNRELDARGGHAADAQLALGLVRETFHETRQEAAKALDWATVEFGLARFDDEDREDWGGRRVELEFTLVSSGKVHDVDVDLRDTPRGYVIEEMDFDKGW